MGNQLATTGWLMLRPVISLKGELNECVLIPPAHPSLLI